MNEHIKWTNGDELCPKCQAVIQDAVTESKDYVAERCVHCKWQVNFNPVTKKVRYGSYIPSY